LKTRKPQHDGDMPRAGEETDIVPASALLEQQALYEQAVKEYSLIRQYQKLQEKVDGGGHPVNGSDERQTESR
jgi:hypothetical protein